MQPSAPELNGDQRLKVGQPDVHPVSIRGVGKDRELVGGLRGTALDSFEIETQVGVPGQSQQCHEAANAGFVQERAPGNDGGGPGSGRERSCHAGFVGRFPARIKVHSRLGCDAPRLGQAGPFTAAGPAELVARPCSSARASETRQLDVSEVFRHILTHQRIEAIFYRVEVSDQDTFEELLNKYELDGYSTEQILTLPKPKLMVNYLDHQKF